MKKITLLACAIISCTLGFAQRTPTHPLDIKDASYDQLASYFDSWKPGTQPAGVSRMDDEFYISRVRPLTRIKEGDYYADSKVDPNRKMCLWVPLDDPTVTWKALPRYCFEGDNFSLWSYVDIHGNWTAPWMRVTAGLSDVAHKNGVMVGCVMSIPFGARISLNGWSLTGHSRVLAKLTEPTSDNKGYKNSRKLVELMKYYGINGLGVNSEFHSDRASMSRLIDFFEDCHKKAKEIGWDFQLHWYDGTNESGTYQFDGGLGSHNSKMFGRKDHEVTDMMFANYNWGKYHLTASENTAASLGRSSYDYYAGFDIQGRALKNGYWQDLLDSKISVGFWGAHAQSLIHQSATDNGTKDIAIQEAYLQKQEKIFSGGYRNPACRPEIYGGSTLANSDLTRFHGVAAFVTAKSTIQQVPFVSRFNLGNGLSFRNEGKVTFDHKWYNLNTQDFMPTWRWWITNESDEVKVHTLGTLVNADLTFDDAYFGGSCLKLHGATPFSRVKLFKTMLEVDGSHKISLIYKKMKNKESHAKLFVALKDNVTDYKEIDLPAVTNLNEWTKFEAPLSQLGINSAAKIAMIGIVVKDSPADYEMRVGELAVRNPAKTFAPVQPEIKETQILRGRYNALDFKMRYASKEETNGIKTYNDEVDTWYYEILYQEQGQPEQVLTATASWAAYVIDAPIVGTGERKARFGVRAVAPDGLTKSAIRWTNYETIPYNQPLSDVVMDRPVIKANETFTMTFLDKMVSAAKEWKVTNALTGATVKTEHNTTSMTLSLPTEGTYDLEITDAKGEKHMMRGKIQITPAETGAVPQVLEVKADKTSATANEQVKYTYRSVDGEGTVSRALAISDPNMFMIPADVQQGKDYSYALWFKVDRYMHDKQGTNLINKNTVKDRWPHNNWGDLWVTIRPKSNKNGAEEVSFNTMGWEAHDLPNFDMISKGYSMAPGVWYHLVVTHNNGNRQRMYINGKQVAQTVFTRSKRREDRTDDDRIRRNVDADIFIGGGGVYKAGFNGWIDEVQVWDKELEPEEVLQAMKGYEQGKAPQHLKAYYTFETKRADGTFPNLGSASSDFTGKLVTIVGGGGEKTDNAAYVAQHADNNILGYPGITGTFPIKAKHTWALENAQGATENGKEVVVTYTTAGKYGAGVTVTNEWGSASLTKTELVEITTSTGINDVEETVEFAAYPNPFIESVNLRFAEAGTYTLNVLNTNGALVQSNRLTTGAGQITNVAVTGSKGLYLLQVLKDGKLYKTIKLVKK